MSSDESKFVEVFEFRTGENRTIKTEYIERADWSGISEPCPECGATDFDHFVYEGGHYGHHQETVIQRTDYWDQHGSLYTSCKNCSEVLFKNPAYDILKAFSQGNIPQVDTDETL